MLQRVKVNEEIQQDEISVPPEPINKATALPSPTEKPTKMPTPSCNSPRSAMFLSQEALHFVLGQAMITDTPGQIPDFSKQNTQDKPIGIAEMANGVVHPSYHE